MVFDIRMACIIKLLNPIKKFRNFSNIQYYSLGRFTVQILDLLRKSQRKALSINIVWYCLEHFGLFLRWVVLLRACSVVLG